MAKVGHRGLSEAAKLQLLKVGQELTLVVDGSIEK